MNQKLLKFTIHKADEFMFMFMSKLKERFKSPLYYYKLYHIMKWRAGVHVSFIDLLIFHLEISM